ncbi:MAG: ABC transporter ATP-binding protein, partial [Candidatus Nanopelagicales bacterium]
EQSSSLAADLRILVGTAWRLSPRNLIVQVALLLVAGIVGGASLLLLIPIVNSLASPNSRISLPGLGDVDVTGLPLWVLLAVFVGFTALSALVQRASSINAVAQQQVIVDQLREQAFAAILRARWTFVLSRRRSDIIEVVTVGASRAGLAYQQLLRLSVSVVIFASTTVVALIVSPQVTAIALVGMAVLGLAQSRAIAPSHRMGRAFGERNRDLQAVLTDSMDSLRLVRAHDADEVWAMRLAEAFSDTRQIQIANARRSATVSATSSVGLAAAAAALILVSVWAGVEPAGIALILVLVARMASQVQAGATTAVVLANALPAVGDLTSLTRAARSAAESDAATEASAGRQGTLARSGALALVEFRDVTFRYPASERGVEEVSFEVPRGDITALTGHSGSGKSTTADLVLGLIRPDAGRVLVDGEPLAPSDYRWWRSHVAYVPQETVLIPGTLRDNLVWSVSGEVTDERCWQALDRAAAGFAQSMPQGLETVLGDRGVRLSGGERQRVAIARALLRDPSLLVLDEATSSLDDATEAQVLELLASLTPAVTVLVIAHRASTLQLADHVVRLDSGRVVPAAGP